MEYGNRQKRMRFEGERNERLWSIVLAGGEGTRLRPLDAEGRSIERAYASIPAANFSDSVLAAFPSLLAVATLPPLTWSDWGTPERVLETLRHEGLVPNRPEQLCADWVTARKRMIPVNTFSTSLPTIDADAGRPPPRARS
jgi:hypothetical protein